MLTLLFCRWNLHIISVFIAEVGMIIFYTVYLFFFKRNKGRVSDDRTGKNALSAIVVIAYPFGTIKIVFPHQFFQFCLHSPAGKQGTGDPARPGTDPFAVFIRISEKKI